MPEVPSSGDISVSRLPFLLGLAGEMITGVPGAGAGAILIMSVIVVEVWDYTAHVPVQGLTLRLGGY